MARSYKPSAPFNVAMKILIPVSSEYVSGTLKKVYPDPEDVSDDLMFYGSFKTFGGTENIQNNMYTLINTAVIETWYRPDIKANCRIYICETAEIYELAGDPEDISMRHQYLKFKVRKVGGKA